MGSPENLGSSSEIHAGQTRKGETVVSDDRSSDLPGPAGPSGNSGLSPEEKKRILRERARKLAKPPEEEDRGQEVVEVIEFNLAHERYAMDVQYVREVYPLKDLTPVPCVPSFVLGIMSVRGQIISITDIRQFFDLPAKEITDQSKVLILRNDKMEMGILADSVVGERKIPVAEIQTDMPMLRGLREHYVRGVTQDRLVVIDVDKFLSDDAMVVHQEVDE
jgi:purine-binding chemotaxis protein CheW